MTSGQTTRTSAEPEPALRQAASAQAPAAPAGQTAPEGPAAKAGAPAAIPAGEDAPRDGIRFAAARPQSIAAPAQAVAAEGAAAGTRPPGPAGADAAAPVEAPQAAEDARAVRVAAQPVEGRPPQTAMAQAASLSPDPSRRISAAESGRRADRDSRASGGSSPDRAAPDRAAARTAAGQVAPAAQAASQPAPVQPAAAQPAAAPQAGFDPAAMALTSGMDGFDGAPVDGFRPLSAEAAAAHGQGELRAASASGAAQNGAGTAPARADTAAIVRFASQVGEHAGKGSSHFEIRMDPPELGRVEVRLHIDSENKAHAVLLAERPDTLSDLSRAARALERALEEAGLKLAQNGLEFGLKRDSGSGAGAGDGGARGQGRTGAGPSGAAGPAAQPDGAPAAPPEERITRYGFQLARAARLAVRV